MEDYQHWSALFDVGRTRTYKGKTGINKEILEKRKIKRIDVPCYQGHREDDQTRSGRADS